MRSCSKEEIRCKETLSLSTVSVQEASQLGLRVRVRIRIEQDLSARGLILCVTRRDISPDRGLGGEISSDYGVD